MASPESPQRSPKTESHEVKKQVKPTPERSYEQTLGETVIDKMALAYNRSWADRHEKKAAAWKDKMDGIDLQNNALEESKKKLRP